MKARHEMVEAVAGRYQRSRKGEKGAILDFPLLGIDSDNGSEFINHGLDDYCREEKIPFTRPRPARKNDNCFVEQKNWPVVRRAVRQQDFAVLSNAKICSKSK